MIDLIDRQAAINALENTECELLPEEWDDLTDAIMNLPSAEPVRCKDCFYGYLYSGVCNGTTCSWVECKNPDGLNRDVSIDGYCYAAIRRKDNG